MSSAITPDRRLPTHEDCISRVISRDPAVSSHPDLDGAVAVERRLREAGPGRPGHAGERPVNAPGTVTAVLASRGTGLDTVVVTAKTMLHSVLEWLRAGYPNGVPGPDRVPLLALLRNTPLTEDEIKDVVREIAAEESHAPAGHRVDHDEIEHFIADHVHHDAGEENVRRVAARLAAAGWPLAGMGPSAGE